MVHQSLFFTLIFVAVVFAKELTDPIKINPVPDSITTEIRPSRPRSFFIGTVVDSSEHAQTAVLGYTRTSRRTQSPLVASPDPAVALKRSLGAIFDSQGLLVDNEGDVDFILNATIVAIRMEEESRFLHQKMRCFIIIEIRIMSAADRKNTTTFIVETENERTAVNTTYQAESVLQDAFRGVIKQILKKATTL